jgi:hypothetical protein
MIRFSTRYKSSPAGGKIRPAGGTVAEFTFERRGPDAVLTHQEELYSAGTNEQQHRNEMTLPEIRTMTNEAAVRHGWP